MARTVVSVVRGTQGAARAAEPALEANAYAVAADLEVRVVLAGDGVELALTGAASRPAELAGVALPPTASAQDLRGLIESGVTVSAVAEDLADRGIAPRQLVDGVETLERAALAAVLRAADAVLAW